MVSLPRCQKFVYVCLNITFVIVLEMRLCHRVIVLVIGYLPYWTDVGVGGLLRFTVSLLPHRLDNIHPVEIQAQ